jgi:CheY-like chemotaxis protein
MIDAATKICNVRELFARMSEAAFGSVAPKSVTVTMPDYLPPVVIAADAERWMVFASVLMTAWGARDVTICATADYDDRPDPADSAVVLSIEMRRQGEDGDGAVESAWVQEIGKLAEELLARSIALTLRSSDDQLTFEFRFPVHGYGVRKPVHRDTILLVEDDEFVRRVAQEVLETSGHRVVAKATAEEGLTFCEENRECVCLVISDVTLPAGNGKQLAAAVHALLPQVPVLLISGYSQNNCEDRLHGIHFLPKPFNADALLTAAKRCLGDSRDAARARVCAAPAEDRATAFC